LALVGPAWLENRADFWGPGGLIWAEATWCGQLGAPGGSTPGTRRCFTEVTGPRGAMGAEKGGGQNWGWEKREGGQTLEGDRSRIILGRGSYTTTHRVGLDN